MNRVLAQVVRVVERTLYLPIACRTSFGLTDKHVIIVNLNLRATDGCATYGHDTASRPLRYADAECLGSDADRTEGLKQLSAI